MEGGTDCPYHGSHYSIGTLPVVGSEKLKAYVLSVAKNRITDTKVYPDGTPKFYDALGDPKTDAVYPDR